RDWSSDVCSSDLKRQVLAHDPVEKLFATCHGTAVVQQTVDQRVHGKAFRNGSELFADASEFSQRHCGVCVVCPLGIQEWCPVGGVLALVLGKLRLSGELAVFHDQTVFLHHLLGFCF